MDKQRIADARTSLLRMSELLADVADMFRDVTEDVSDETGLVTEGVERLVSKTTAALLAECEWFTHGLELCEGCGAAMSLDLERPERCLCPEVG